jgi:hypothetical protein
VERPPPRTSLAVVAAIVLGAAVWFWPGTWLTLEWVDQGQIVYGAWRVARGDLPYRDFDHLYGPSLFVLNGALLRWFGEDLMVIRLGLLAVKALLAGLLYVVCRSVARPAIALLVTAWFVVQWGAPLWIYATPYASHYTFACSLAGLAILLGRPATGWRPAFAAGLCVGLGATFKQTTGLFAAAGIAMALASAPAPEGARDGLAGIARATRALAAIAVAAIVAGYLAPTLETWTGALLMAPPLFAMVLDWLHDLRQERALAAGRPRVVRVLAFGAGFGAPLLAWAAIYASQGALADLVHDTLVGLPQRLHWFVPLAPPHPITLVFAALLAVAAGGLAAGRALPVAGAGLGTLVLFAAAAVVPGWGIVTAESARMLPIALVWTVAPLALRHDGGEPPRLLWWFGALVCISLYPASDLPHTFMILPAVIPLLALLVDRAWSRAATSLARAGLAVVVGVPLLVRAQVDAVGLARAVAARPAGDEGFARARGVWDPMPPFEAMRQAVAWVDREVPPGAPLLVLPSAQLLYVLADRPSALPEAEMIFYLLAVDVMRPEDARELLSDDDLVAGLARRRPLIILARDAGWRRIAAAFPRLRDWVDRHYEVSATADGLELLRPRPDPRGVQDPT